MPKRKIWREGDENVCSLGFRWGVDEPDPHFDAALYDLQKKLIEMSKEGEQPVDKYLAALVTKCLLSEEDDPLHVHGPDLIRRIDQAALTK